MRYYGTPGLSVIDYKKLKKVFQFDENGEYETQDPKLIEWMKKKKNFIRCEEIAVETILNCKKCKFTTNNRGELLQHYKREHKKAEGE